MTSPDAVVLRPLVRLSDFVPIGYLTRCYDGGQQLSELRWTLQALKVLAPGAFLAAEVSAGAVGDPAFPELVSQVGPSRLLPILPTARVGRGLVELTDARRRIRALGMKAAVTGARLGSAGEFDALVARPPFAFDLRTAGKLLIVTGLSSADDIGWAEDKGAEMVEGKGVAEPIRVAPVDLKRLRR